MLLHGLMGSPGNFEKTARELVDKHIPVRAPLYGQRGTVALDSSLQELIDALPNSPVDIVGHSLGGLMGLRLAQLFPGRVRTLVGLGACFHGLPPRGRTFTLAARALMGPATSELMGMWGRADVRVPEGTRVVSLVSDADTVVPRSSSEVGEVRQVHGVRHELLPSLGAEVVDALAWQR